MEQPKVHPKMKDLPPWMSIRVKARMKDRASVSSGTWLLRVLILTVCLCVLLVLCPALIQGGIPVWKAVLECLCGSVTIFLMSTIMLDDPMMVSPVQYDEVLDQVLQDLTAHERMAYEEHVRAREYELPGLSRA